MCVCVDLSAGKGDFRIRLGFLGGLFNVAGLTCCLLTWWVEEVGGLGWMEGD